MMSEATERAVLENLVPSLQAEGYEVVVQPSRAILPAFLRGYRPDAIAMRRGRSLAIEVKAASPQATKMVGEIQRLFEGQPDWEFRVVWVGQSDRQKPLSLQPRRTISNSINEIRQLLAEGHILPALLMAWATFEAVGRVIEPESFERPQTPARLVQTLAQNGTLTPSQADLSRSLIDKRNRLIHGEISTDVATQDVSAFVDVIDAIVDQNIRQI